MSYTLTDKELSVLSGIVRSDYSISGDPDENVGNAIWSWSIDSEFANTPSCGGIVSSLVKKGLAKSNGEGDDATTSITQAGADALRELAPEMFSTRRS